MIPNQVVLVAELEEGVVGFIAIEGEWVEHLYIAPAHQGIGIGDALLTAGEGIASRGPDAVDVREATIARESSTNSRGFVAVEFTDGSRNEERTPDVRYQWKLSR